MDNYQLFNNEKIKYLTYLINSIKSKEVKLSEYFTDRDIKLKLVLDNDFSKAKKEISINIDRIKSRINNIDIMDPESISMSNLEEISNEFDLLVKYIEYTMSFITPKSSLIEAEGQYYKIQK